MAPEVSLKSYECQDYLQKRWLVPAPMRGGKITRESVSPGRREAETAGGSAPTFLSSHSAFRPGAPLQTPTRHYRPQLEAEGRSRRWRPWAQPFRGFRARV